MKWDFSKHVKGKVYDLTQENLNACIETVEALRTEVMRYSVQSKSYLDTVKGLREEIQTHIERVYAQESELADLRWFRDRINEGVIPGETDTHDSARKFINGCIRRFRHLEAENARLTERVSALSRGVDYWKEQMNRGDREYELEAEIERLKEYIGEITAKSMDQEAVEDRLREALEKIADADYRGNRSSESQIAWQALSESALITSNKQDSRTERYKRAAELIGKWARKPSDYDDRIMELLDEQVNTHSRVEAALNVDAYKDLGSASSAKCGMGIVDCKCTDGKREKS